MESTTARQCTLLERDRRIYESYCSDPATTYRDLAKRFGLSHERIRQIVDRLGLPEAKASRDARRAIGEQQLAYEQFVRRAEQARPCVMCGYWVLRGRGRTCSPACGVAYRTSSVRFAIDEAERSRHRERMARYWLKKGTETQKRHARRVLKGVATQRGRWHLPGSRTAETLRRFCPEKLPPPPGGVGQQPDEGRTRQ